MLPTALVVTLVTFLLDLTNSSPVYNMQPAFITKNIGFTNGRNIKNLPCVSRRNKDLTGVCMFAKDCMKSNGTHLGTCIDRSYFGSCCHVEPSKEIETNIIETNIILNSREPPRRGHNKTVQTTTKRPTKRPTQTSKKSPSTTSKPKPKTTKSNKPSRKTTPKSTKPVKDSSTTRRPAATTTKSTSTRKLPTSKPIKRVTRPQSGHNKTVQTTTKRPTKRPTQTSNKSPSTTSKPKPKTTKSNKPTRKTTPKPTKPVKVSSTTRRPAATTTKSTSTRKPPTSKPIKRVTRPSVNVTTAKPISTSPKRPQTTTVRTTRKPSIVTKKPVISITRSPASTITERATTTSPRPTSIPESSTSISTTQSTTSTTSTPLATTSSSVISTFASPSEEILSKKNDTQILESSTINTTNNEILEYSPSTTSSPSPLSTSNVSEQITINTTTTSAMKPMDTSSSLSTDSPKEEVPSSTVNITSTPTTTSTSTSPSTNTSTSTTTPSTIPGVWTIDDPKNHTIVSVDNETLLIGNITEAIPTTTPSSDVTATQETIAGSVSAQETTSSSASAITSIVTSTSEGEKITTSMPSMTNIGNVTVTEGDGSGGSFETSSMATSTEYVPESKPVNMSDFTDVCGRRMWTEARITGGKKSVFGKWPWQISLIQEENSTYVNGCGAALLNEHWAITAAHCVEDVPPNALIIRLGEYDFSTEGEPYLHEDRLVHIVALHPQYDPDTAEYDLALLRFYEPVVFQPNILPVCLPTKDEDFVGRTAYVTGWGILYEDGPSPSILQEVSVPVISNTVCESMFRSAGYIENISHNFICAGRRRGGVDACNGDSGGPMVIQREDNRFLLAGVVSYGYGCALPNQPGVYTRISEFIEWINQVLKL